MKKDIELYPLLRVNKKDVSKLKREDIAIMKPSKKSKEVCKFKDGVIKN